jgi:hypothetical protein
MVPGDFPGYDSTADSEHVTQADEFVTQQKPNPSAFILPGVHSFETRDIRKEISEDEINGLSNEGFDVFINYMVGMMSNQAVRYSY